jgi:RNA polymerase sigma factor (sigma-70 family)
MTWLAEDRERLVRFRRGDAAVLREVYGRYAPGLMAELSARYGGSGGVFGGPFELADAVQETFIKAFADNARAQYDGLRPYATYLSVIARHRVIDVWRQLDRRGSLHEQALADLASEHAERVGGRGPERAVEQAELVRLLSAFLATLGEAERAVVKLRLVEDRPRREVSAATGMGAMRVRLAEERLRRRLHAWLCEAGVSPNQGMAQALVWLGVLLCV